MTRYIVLLNFLEKGFGNVAESPERAEQFRLLSLSTGDCFWNWDMVAGLIDGEECPFHDSVRA